VLLFCGRESLASRVPYCQAGYFREWLPTAPYKLTPPEEACCLCAPTPSGPKFFPRRTQASSRGRTCVGTLVVGGRTLPAPPKGHLVSWLRSTTLLCGSGLLTLPSQVWSKSHSMTSMAVRCRPHGWMPTSFSALRLLLNDSTELGSGAASVSPISSVCDHESATATLSHNPTLGVGRDI